MLVELKDATFGYGGRAVVSAGELSVAAGVCLGLFGPNGSGKTTLVRGITGLLPPMSGQVRREIGVRFGYLPQHRTMELHWPMSGLDAAALAVSARRRLGWIAPVKRQIREAMSKMGVGDLADAPFAKLSGGQQQRLLLAGTLAAEPHLLVLDEPTDGLDVHSRHDLLAILREQTMAGLGIVMITHDVEDLLCVADRVAWVHPADEAGKPSWIHMLAPGDLARQIMAAPSMGVGV